MDVEGLLMVAPIGGSDERGSQGGAIGRAMRHENGKATIDD